MIKRVRIKNFQSHQKTELKLDPHFNVIVGPSDSGKSAILRALRWLITNDLKGDYYVSSWGDGSTSVGVELSDGTKIIRYRNRKDNGYKVGDKIFPKSGKGVPPEVETVFGDTSMNFHDQYDGVFMFSESAGQVTQLFNQVAGLQIIDNMFSWFNSQLRKLSGRLDALGQEQKEKEEKLKRLEWVDKAEKVVERLQALQKKREQVQQKIDTLERDMRKLQGAEKVLSQLSWVKKAAAVREKLENLVKRRTDVEEKIEILNSLLKALDDYAEKAESAWNKLTELKEKLPKVCPTCGQPIPCGGQEHD